MGKASNNWTPGMGIISFPVLPAFQHSRETAFFPPNKQFTYSPTRQGDFGGDFLCHPDLLEKCINSNNICPLIGLI